MSVTYVIGFTVKREERDRFLQLLNGVLDAMRTEENFRNAVLHHDPLDRCRFLLYETWADHQDVMEVQLERSYRVAWHEALGEMLERPRDVSMWVPQRADGSV